MSDIMKDKTFTPREVVSELDRFIVGQHAAKRAVAIALRNRWRRRRVDPALRDEIAPKNIILMGPTGSGKTEIARRLAKLADAPFVKVEATKYTEVGYVGRDVESMVRDLAEASVKLVKAEALANVATRAKDMVEERLLDLLLPRPERRVGFPGVPFDARETSSREPSSESDSTRERFRQMLRDGGLDDRDVEIEVTSQGPAPMMQMFAQPGLEEMTNGLQEALQSALGGKGKKRRKMKIKDARVALEHEEAQKLLDVDQIQREAIERAEQAGIIFIDEIDKIAGGGRGQGPDVSREGVQRDILPIVEGSTVNTKYGQLKTDHVLFIAAGAFHMSKPSDLIPELQGRFPIRVELEGLTEADFVRILKEPENSLVKQYRALLATEGVTLDFTDDGIVAIANVAARVNEMQENIGARRLHTVLERLLEDVSFHAPDRSGQKLVVDGAFVHDKLAPSLKSEDLSRYVL
jgi:ATP-dependent HslUV protease ATP-binding subunit HslU